jgi:hypothetical protein
MSPSPNWYSASDANDQLAYRWWDGDMDALVWKQDGRWKMHLNLDAGSETLHIDLGKTRSVEKALARADHTIGVAQDIDDVQNVVDMASEIEDRTPAEQASIDRLTSHLREMAGERDVVAEQTVVLRAEVKTAWEALQASRDDYELEEDYFEKLDALDHNLMERGLERGVNIDEEVPLRPELRRPPFDRHLERDQANGYDLGR